MIDTPIYSVRFFKSQIVENNIILMNFFLEINEKIFKLVVLSILSVIRLSFHLKIDKRI